MKENFIKNPCLLFLLLLLSSCSYLRTSSNECNNLVDCTNLSSKLTGKKYIYGDMRFNGPVATIGKVQWTKENADFLIGEMLASSSYVRVKTNDQNLFQIISGRDIRYAANLPSISATKSTNDDLPAINSADWAELTYKSTNGFSRPSEIARNLRPFMTRYGKVIDDHYAGLIIIRDSVANIHQLLPLIRKMDVPLSKEEISEHEKQYKLEILREKTRLEMAASIEEYLRKIKLEKKEEKKLE